ncbi:dihydrofolate reductase [Candidatus Saccharibacteria bacterium]|nr:dihydrofolate reductase [Candidatus Saccharibacteria bacterium]
MSLSIIAAVGKNRELGKKGGLCFKIPGDLKFFKETTMGYPVLMGLTTWHSLPGKLPGRKHYVLSFDENEDLPEGVDVVTDLNAFLEKWQKSKEKMFVIGGASVYQQALPYCDEMYLTEVNAEDKDADVLFPEFACKDWQRKEVGRGEDDGLKYIHVLYTRK